MRVNACVCVCERERERERERECAIVQLKSTEMENTLCLFVCVRTKRFKNEKKERERN